MEIWGSIFYPPYFHQFNHHHHYSVFLTLEQKDIHDRSAGYPADLFENNHHHQFNHHHHFHHYYQ